MIFIARGLRRLAWLRPVIDYRRQRRDDAQLQRIDASTLRDLAIDRSELASFLAEARGEAQATRLRVALLGGTRGGA